MFSLVTVCDEKSYEQVNANQRGINIFQKIILNLFNSQLLGNLCLFLDILSRIDEFQLLNKSNSDGAVRWFDLVVYNLYHIWPLEM